MQPPTETRNKAERYAQVLLMGVFISMSVIQMFGVDFSALLMALILSGFVAFLLVSGQVFSGHWSSLRRSPLLFALFVSWLLLSFVAIFRSPIFFQPIQRADDRGILKLRTGSIFESIE